MDLKEQVLIRASREKVWARIINPANWPQWNPKVSDVRREKTGPVVEGEHFSATLHLNTKRTICQIEVRQCHEWTRLVLRHQFEDRQRQRHVDVAFELKPMDDCVRLVQLTDLRGTGMSWFLRAFLWWIQRTGRPVGVSALERLQQQLQSEEKTAQPQVRGVRTA